MPSDVLAVASDLEVTIRAANPSSYQHLNAPQTSMGSSPNLALSVESSSVSATGSFGNLAQENLSKFSGSQYVALTNSGTAALHLAFQAVGVRSGDDVICQSLSFVATSNSIRYLDAFPVYLDVDLDDLALSPAILQDFLTSRCKTVGNKLINLDTGRTVSAIVVVSVFGLSPKMFQLASVAGSFGLPLVLDGAGALGTSEGNRQVLSIADVAIVSFNGNKIITSGMGGAVFTNNLRVFQKVEYLSKVAKDDVPGEFWHSELGFNYRMPELNAAFLLDQLATIDDIMSAKRNLHFSYSAELRGRGYEVVEERLGTRSNYWLNTVSVEKFAENRAIEVSKVLNEQGFGTRPIWTPSHLLAHLKHSSSMGSKMTNTEYLWKNLISLPSSPILDGSRAHVEH